MTAVLGAEGCLYMGVCPFDDRLDCDDCRLGLGSRDAALNGSSGEIGTFQMTASSGTSSSESWYSSSNCLTVFLPGAHVFLLFIPCCTLRKLCAVEPGIDAPDRWSPLCIRPLVGEGDRESPELCGDRGPYVPDVLLNPGRIWRTGMFVLRSSSGRPPGPDRFCAICTVRTLSTVCANFLLEPIIEWSGRVGGLDRASLE